ncbi:MAG: chromate efflux transporter [Acidobacteria bacterium]|nr:MAG: chromate efflux transporter [Acidobacteriota bacterium]
MLHSMRGPLSSLALLFLRLGTTAFGGPAAHIALMEDEVVRRRRWLSREEFLDYLGATNLIPGPNSTELAIHIGRSRAGWPGLVVAGACFILPATLIVGAAAWAYLRFGMRPEAEGLLYGVKPVVMAVVTQALAGLGKSAVKSPALAVIGLLAVAAVAAGVHELAVLAGAGVVMAAWRVVSDGGPRATRALNVLVAAGLLLAGARATAGAPLTGGTMAAATATTAAAAAATAPFGLWPLFLVFAKAGAVLFGSGYVLLAFLRADLVERLGWLTSTQLLDAIAVGQVTPGPVFTTATFIGYVLGGPAGAAVATIGIFLPAFVFVAVSGPLVPRLRRSPTAGAVLDGVNVASLALMTVASWQLGRAALVDPLTVLLALLSLASLVLIRINSAWLIAIGAVIGWLAY